MEKGKLTTKILTMERQGIFDKNLKKRYELTFTYTDSDAKKSVLVIGLNPASSDISVLDTTTMFILNNLMPMGYTTITICNLYADLFKRLKPSEIPNNRDNREYMADLLKRGFDTILIGYGNTFTTNKYVKEEKAYLKKLLQPYKEIVVDIVDDKDEFKRLTATHPLMAGRYFPNRWKLRPFNLVEEELKAAAKPPENKNTKHEEKASVDIKGGQKNEKGSTNKNHESVVSTETNES